MKRLHFDYYMGISYEKPVDICHYTIKCIPADTDRQKLELIHVEIEPRDYVSEETDSFGNRYLYGTVGKPHDQFYFHITGNVITGLMDSDRIANENMLGLFRFPYGLTVPGEEIKAYHEKLEAQYKKFLNAEYDLQTEEQQPDAFRKAEFLMHALYKDFTYEKGVTDVSTTAEKAWSQKKGVCQDYAHILIAICRLSGIPARYVAGMLTGEGYSHAWVEILSKGRWYALDPTNDLIVDTDHIRLGIGRDAMDCQINRGVMRGGGKQGQEIRVSVTKI